MKVAGNLLVDAQGQPIRLLGVDLSGAEYACIDDLGIFAGPTDGQTVAAMASWDINAVRLPLNEDCWLGINGAPTRYSGARYRAAIRQFVTRLNQAGFYVILDLHWNAPGTVKATGQQPMADLDHAPAFWSSVARDFVATRPLSSTFTTSRTTSAGSAGETVASFRKAGARRACRP